MLAYLLEMTWRAIKGILLILYYLIVMLFMAALVIIMAPIALVTFLLFRLFVCWRFL